MPHTSHRKKPARTKRAQVVDENGWTRVTSVNPGSRAPQPPFSETSLDKGSVYQIFGYHKATAAAGVTLEKLRRRFQEVEQRWLVSASWKTLSAVLEKKIDQSVLRSVQEAVVFGTGSYSGMSNGWVERFEVSLYQLAAFKAVVDTIERITGRRPRTKAQEPVYNEVDAQLLNELNIEKVDHPVGFESLSSRSFAFAPCAELSVEMCCLEADPAVTMLMGKLDHHWRNEKGQACTNRVMSFKKESDGNCSDSPPDNEPPPSPLSQDRLERHLQTMERFLQSKDTFSLPDLDVKDFPFSDVHVFARRIEVEQEEKQCL